MAIGSYITLASSLPRHTIRQEDELRSAAGVAIQMCREVGLNVEKLIGEVNTKKIKRNV